MNTRSGFDEIACLELAHIASDCDLAIAQQDYATFRDIILSHDSITVAMVVMALCRYADGNPLKLSTADDIEHAIATIFDFHRTPHPFGYGAGA